MKSIDDEIARIDAEIERLRVRKQAFLDMKAMIGGAPATNPHPAPQSRKRSANVKPIILEIMATAGMVGATSAEVAEAVKAKVPTVAKDTVGSVLSRLKADGALHYDGERYYDARYSPVRPPPFGETSSRSVN